MTRNNVCLTQKSIEVRERPLSKNSLDNTDVFILDLGEEIYQVSITTSLILKLEWKLGNETLMFLYYQWNGEEANKDERFKASQYLTKLKVSNVGLLDC